MNESTVRKMVAQVLREMHEANLEEDNLVSKEDLEKSEEETIDEMNTQEESRMTETE